MERHEVSPVTVYGRGVDPNNHKRRLVGQSVGLKDFDGEREWFVLIDFIEMNYPLYEVELVPCPPIIGLGEVMVN